MKTSLGHGKDAEGEKDSGIETLLQSNYWLFFSKELTHALDKAVVLLCDILKQPARVLKWFSKELNCYAHATGA